MAGTAIVANILKVYPLQRIITVAGYHRPEEDTIVADPDPEVTAPGEEEEPIE